MVPVPKVALDNASEAIVAEQLAAEPIECGRPSRDRGGDQSAPGAQDAERLGERLMTIP